MPTILSLEKSTGFYYNEKLPRTHLVVVFVDVLVKLVQSHQAVDLGSVILFGEIKIALRRTNVMGGGTGC